MIKRIIFGLFKGVFFMKFTKIKEKKE